MAPLTCYYLMAQWVMFKEMLICNTFYDIRRFSMISGFSLYLHKNNRICYTSLKGGRK